MENQKLNRGADAYPSMDAAAAGLDSATGLSADPAAEKPAGAAELMTPDNAPGPADDPNNPQYAAPGQEPGGAADRMSEEQRRDVRMQSRQPGSVDTNYGEGAGTADGTGATDTA